MVMKPPKYIYNTRITLFVITKDYMGEHTEEVAGVANARVEMRHTETKSSSGVTVISDGFVIMEADGEFGDLINGIEVADVIYNLAFRPDNWYFNIGEKIEKDKLRWYRITEIKPVMSHNNLSHYEILFKLSKGDG